MATTVSSLVDVSPESVDATSTTTSPSLTTGSRSPRHKPKPPQIMTDAESRRQQRHSKRLSINFPILVPSRADTPNSTYTASPTASSAHLTTQNNTFYPPMSVHASHAAVPSSIALPMPLTPPSELEQPLQQIGRARSVSKGHGRQASTSTEFLTLLASQERKVLELKDELLRAETELTTLKKQWALYEANKKKGESKGIPVRMNSVHKSHTRAQSVVEAGTGLGLIGLEEPMSEEQLEAEREKKRELARERMMGRLPNTDGTSNGNNSTRKNGQRVFQNSRHTRTLSLLTATSGTRNERTGSLDSDTDTKPSLDSPRRSTVNTPVTMDNAVAPSLSRSNSGLEGLNLGKTYKDLANAASRKNLPQSLSPEQFVKHGKQVVDGMRDGLWNFFEDIRQATVGEEAINGGNNGVRRQPSTKHPDAAGNTKLKRTLTDGGRKSPATRDQKASDTSFWKEFGMDTPQSDKVKRNSTDPEPRPSLPGRWPSTKTGPDFQHAISKRNSGLEGKIEEPTAKATKPQQKKKRSEHHESKSSTDSQNPPSLLADLLDDEDDGWDNWDSNTDPGSPQSARKRQGRRAAKRSIDISVQGNEDKAVQWHDLMS